MSADRIIVVAGATGLQGGATARRLVADGWRVRALTRNPAAPSAQALARAGMELAQASFDDRPALDRALAGAHGVFVMGTPFGKGQDVSSEERHGRALADAAKGAGVAHLVYSSVGGAERNSRVPHFESKWRVEEHIRGLGVPATMLRPAVFMDMLLAAGLPMRMMLDGMLRAGLGRDKAVQMVAVDDIAVFAAMAFARPDEFLGRALEIAGDSLTVPQIGDTYRRVSGRWFGRLPMPRAVMLRMPEEMSRMMVWFGESGFQADISALRAMHSGLLTFAARCAQPSGR